MRKTLRQYVRVSKKLTASASFDVEWVREELRRVRREKIDACQGVVGCLSFKITGPTDHVVYDEEGNVAFVMDEYMSNTVVEFAT